MNRPMGVIRGSWRILEHRPVLLVEGLEGGAPGLGVDHHRAELQHVEGAAVEAHPPLAVEDRTAVELDEGRHHAEQRREHQEGHRRGGDVEEALGGALVGLGLVGPVVDVAVVGAGGPGASEAEGGQGHGEGQAQRLADRGHPGEDLGVGAGVLGDVDLVHRVVHQHLAEPRELPEDLGAVHVGGVAGDPDEALDPHPVAEGVGGGPGQGAGAHDDGLGGRGVGAVARPEDEQAQEDDGCEDHRDQQLQGGHRRAVGEQELAAGEHHDDAGDQQGGHPQVLDPGPEPGGVVVPEDEAEEEPEAGHQAQDQEVTLEPERQAPAVGDEEAPRPDDGQIRREVHPRGPARQ